MPRDLADVLHYFLPELDAPRAGGSAPEARGPNRIFPSSEDPPGSAPEPTRRAMPRPESRPLPGLMLPLVAVPIGERDLVRAALTWNLAIEMTRLGGRAVVVAPASTTHTPLWPEAGVGPLGSELVRCPVANLKELESAALQIASERTCAAPRGGAVFVRVPPEWLDAGQGPADSIRWWLLMTSSHRRHLDGALDCARRIRALSPAAEIGATIHGVSTIAEARRAYEHLARLCDAELALELKSYGLLVDDLDVYRAIAAQRPIGLAHPQAPATRALVDVARLVYDDARSQTLG